MLDCFRKGRISKLMLDNYERGKLTRAIRDKYEKAKLDRLRLAIERVVGPVDVDYEALERFYAPELWDSHEARQRDSMGRFI
jgi:hypothetical protein